MVLLVTFLHSYTKGRVRPAETPVRGPGLGALRVRSPMQRMLKQNESKMQML